MRMLLLRFLILNNELDMKSYCIATFLVLLVFFDNGCINSPRRNAKESEPSVFIYRTGYERGGVKEWRIPLSWVEQMPVWKSEGGNPPISINHAVEVARKWVFLQCGDSNPVLNNINLCSINPDEEKFRYKFYYLVYFGVRPFGNHFTCIVLMDGEVLKPIEIK